jgi:hypothetical protein
VTPSFTSVRGSGSRRLATTSVGATHDGVTHLTLAQSGSVSLVASAKGDIRSAATTIKVVPQR